MKKNAFIMSVFCNSRVKKKQIFAILKRTLFQIFQTLLKLLLKKKPLSTLLRCIYRKKEENTAPDVFKQVMFDKHIRNEYFYINFK